MFFIIPADRCPAQPPEFWRKDWQTHDQPNLCQLLVLLEGVESPSVEAGLEVWQREGQVEAVRLVVWLVQWEEWVWLRPSVADSP